MAVINRLLNILEKLLSYVAFLCFISLIAVVTLQIASRLFLPWVFAWTEELSRFLFITVICCISPAALRHNELVFVDFLINRMKNKYILELLQNLMLIFFLASIVSGSFAFMTLGYANTSPVLKIPMWLSYAMPSISFIFLLLFSLEKTVILNLSRNRNKVK